MTTAGTARLLYELACTFAEHLELDELVPLVVEKCRSALDADGASLMLLDESANELFFHTSAEDPAVVKRLRALRFPADRGIAGAVLGDGRALRVDDVAADPRFYSAIDRQSGTTTRNMVCAPLSVHGRRVGVVQVVNRHAGAFDDADLRLLETLASSIAVALQNARRYEVLRQSEETLRTQVLVLRRDLAQPGRFADLIGDSPVMRELFALMHTAAASPIAVLIQGETGTGKELVARGIHRASLRGDKTFVPVNCAAIPESMLERELFGHRRGAFTGALQDQRGLLEAADGGTLLFDEIGDMPLAMQAKLLRVLQDGEVTPLGDTRPRRVDVRVLSATNRDLAADVTAGRFREDLFYRIGAFPILVPPLRERRADIALLVPVLLDASADRHHKRLESVEADALAALEAHDWPGNVRELQNEIERAVALAPAGGAVALRHLSARIAGAPRTGTVPVASAGGNLREARAAFEAAFIAAALQRAGGNLSQAARELGLSRAMMQRKVRDYALR
ncbi:MAG: sigma 54-interacting transcriptional regulator [Candidatus Binatia bacterium]